MCGRFTQNYTWQQVREFLSVFGAPQNLKAAAGQLLRGRPVSKRE